MKRGNQNLRNYHQWYIIPMTFIIIIFYRRGYVLKCVCLSVSMSVNLSKCPSKYKVFHKRAYGWRTKKKLCMTLR